MTERTDNRPEAVIPEKSGKTNPAAKRRKPVEIGGPKGPEPTRYGDWERKGIASDF